MINNRIAGGEIFFYIAIDLDSLRLRERREREGGGGELKVNNTYLKRI